MSTGIFVFILGKLFEQVMCLIVSPVVVVSDSYLLSLSSYGSWHSVMVFAGHLQGAWPMLHIPIAMGA